jgi:hypothetical protein
LYKHARVSRACSSKWTPVGVQRALYPSVLSEF